jgi:hypothetical protein
METLITEFAKPEAEQDKELLLIEFVQLTRTHEFQPKKLNWEDVQELVELCLIRQKDMIELIQTKKVNDLIDQLWRENDELWLAMNEANEYLDSISDQ